VKLSRLKQKKFESRKISAIKTDLGAPQMRIAYPGMDRGIRDPVQIIELMAAHHSKPFHSSTASGLYNFTDFMYKD